MRFAMVTTFYPPYHFGGDATYVRGLAHALARRGHHVTVLHQRDAHSLLSQGPNPEPLVEPPGVEIHALASRFPGLSCLATHQTGHPVAHKREVEELLSNDFDVIHYQNISLTRISILVWRHRTKVGKTRFLNCDRLAGLAFDAASSR